MKIAVISDIHSNYTALQAVLKDLETESIDAYFFLGDYISDGYQDAEVLSCIREYADLAIVGNRDRIAFADSMKQTEVNMKPIQWTYDHLSSDDKDYLRSLPESVFVEYEGCRMVLVHGDHHLNDAKDAIDLDRLLTLGDFDLCLMGHIHVQFDTVYQGKRFVNVGSCGMPSDGPAYKYAIVDVGKGVELREVAVDPQFKDDFTTSDYYQANPVWGQLIVDSLETGSNCHQVFFDLMTDVKAANPSLSNTQAWHEAFRIYGLLEV